MSRLIAFGCSITHGAGLNDIFEPSDNPSRRASATGGHKNNHDYYGGVGSKFAWPIRLQNQLESSGNPVNTVVNNGWVGASNKRIWNNIVNFNYEEKDIVVVLWTFKERDCMFQEELALDSYFPQPDTDYNPKDLHICGHDYMPSLGDGSHHKGTERLNRNTIYYKHFYSSFDRWKDIWVRVDHAAKVLNNLGLTNMHYFMQDPGVMPKWVTGVNIGDTNVDKNTIKNYPVALDLGHPGKAAHKVLAKKIHNDLLKKLRHN